MTRYELKSQVDGVRLDQFVADNIPDITRTFAVSLIENGNVSVNGETKKKNYKIVFCDSVIVNLPDSVEPEIIPEDIPLDIVYEDEWLLVVNKPKGMVVHPAPGNYEHTLVNALMHHCKGNLSGINGVMRPGIIHRIDKDTSGLLIVAKNDAAHKHLSEQIKEHTFTREYQAVIIGGMKEDKGTVNKPIGRHPIKRKQMAVTYKNSKPAVTHYEVIKRYNGYTHLRLRLETGRTHQIRVHMSSLGHSIVGDEVYGSSKNIFGLQGQTLHAGKIGFLHPKNNEYMEFESDLPDYFTELLNKLEVKY